MSSRFTKNNLFIALCLNLTVYSLCLVFYFSNYVIFQYILKTILSAFVLVTSIKLVHNGRTMNWINISLMVLITSFYSFDYSWTLLLILSVGMIPPLHCNSVHLSTYAYDPKEVKNAYLKTLSEVQQLQMHRFLK